MTEKSKLEQFFEKLPDDQFSEAMKVAEAERQRRSGPDLSGVAFMSDTDFEQFKSKVGREYQESRKNG